MYFLAERKREMMESREREQSAGNDRWGRGEEPARGGGGGWRDGPRDRRDDRMDDRGPPRDRMDDRGPPMRRDDRDERGPRGGDAWKPSSGGGKRDF